MIYYIYVATAVMLVVALFAAAAGLTGIFRGVVLSRPASDIRRASEDELAWSLLSDERRREILEYWAQRYRAPEDADLAAERERARIRLAQIRERLLKPASEPYRLQLTREQHSIENRLAREATNDNDLVRASNAAPADGRGKRAS